MMVIPMNEYMSEAEQYKALHEIQDREGAFDITPMPYISTSCLKYLVCPYCGERPACQDFISVTAIGCSCGETYIVDRRVMYNVWKREDYFDAEAME